MRALVVDEPNVFSVREVERPVPGPHEVLCRVRAIAICGTDPHIIQGHYPGFWPKHWPLVPGTSGAAMSSSSGGRRRLGMGGRHARRGHIARTLRLLPQVRRGPVQPLRAFGVEGLHRQYGHNADGAYADYVVHSIRSVFPVPDSLSDEEAAMLDPTAIALHTVKRSPSATGRHGGGGRSWRMGLLVAECARALGAGRIIVVGRGDRLARAAELGYETVDFTAEDTVQAVRDMTGGLGAEVAMECSGAPEAVGQCAELLRRGGRVAVIGIPLKDAEIPLQRIVLDEIEIVGVRAAAGEMPQAIALVAAGRIRLRSSSPTASRSKTSLMPTGRSPNGPAGRSK